MQLIDGKQTAIDCKKEIANQVVAFEKETGRRPHLAAILVGNDGASQTYVANKERDCRQVGMDSSVYRMPAATSQEEVLECIHLLNEDPEIDGLIVQLPLPTSFNEQEVIQAIDPSKDVDGFHPENVGRTVLGLPSFVSATPAGIMELLERYAIPTKGKHCVIIGRSHIVGRPLANLLSQKGQPGDCTVTLCHSRTENLKEICLQADILVAALGVPRFLKADMVKEGAVVIDVGITREPSATTKSGYTLVGDVDFENVAPKCSYITPVPGGVGPMTIVSLLRNTLKAANHEKKTIS